MISWCRGFWRLWLVGAALWVAVAGYVWFSENAIPSWMRDCWELLSFRRGDTGAYLGQTDVEECRKVWAAKRTRSLGWIFVPPILLLVAGTILGWIFSGFAPRSESHGGRPIGK